MTESITGNNSRSALIALGVGCVLLVFIVVLPVIAAFSAQNDDIQQSLQQLGYYRAEIASQPTLEASLAELDRQGATVPGVVAGDSTALAQAELQRQLKTLIESNQGVVRSEQAVPSLTKEGFESIAVQCDFSIPESQLKNLAYAVGEHKPYLFVDEASISMASSDPDEARNTQPMLDVRWTIHGYRWAPRK
ncbi:MAG TPA: type II secretion system protein GspM [Candidatus Acidoferrum sp.]|nr:type II secretion system protein GspM [Candidatus Acidoferrum sp.]